MRERRRRPSTARENNRRAKYTIALMGRQLASQTADRVAAVTDRGTVEVDL
jgi:hypothetical protein